MLALVSLDGGAAGVAALAVWTAVHRDGIADRLVRLFSFVGNSLPNFLLSVLLMYLFCIRLRLLPVIADGVSGDCCCRA